jgi:hypothetical protein
MTEARTRGRFAWQSTGPILNRARLFCKRVFYFVTRNIRLLKARSSTFQTSSFVRLGKWFLIVSSISEMITFSASNAQDRKFPASVKASLRNRADAVAWAFRSQIADRRRHCLKRLITFPTVNSFIKPPII